MKSEAPQVRSRHAARETAFRTAYAMAVGKIDLEDALDSARQGIEFADETLVWIRSLVGGLMGYPALWDEKFGPFLSSSWPLERISVTDKTLLRMACYETWKLPEIPPKVTISEYVALAKLYGSAESGKFVNGVLASVLKASPKAEWNASDYPEYVRPEEASSRVSEPELAQPKAGWTLKSDG